MEEYQRVGVDLVSAIEKLSEWGTPVGEEPKADHAVERSNEASLNQLTAMMARVKR